MYYKEKKTKSRFPSHYYVLMPFLMIMSLAGQAKNYYFSSSSGNDSYSSVQAQNEGTPWKSIAKLNSFFNSLVPGDNIYFKRGDTFYGSIIITRSGTSGSLITISAYGSGNRPVISGLTTLSSWSAVSGGIYQSYAPAVKNSVNLVTLNGLPQAVGRYPNANTSNGGYATYDSYSSSSITDNQGTGGINWTGAEVVIRKQHYAMEKCRITGQSGTVINYTTTASINPLNGSPTPTTAASGFGYFIQRDARTLDQLGEWYYNTSTRNMQMYFGGNSPSSYNVRVSTLDTLVNVGSANFININNLSFEGGNVAAIYAANAGNLTIQGCDMNNMGGKAILFFNCPNVLIDGINTNNILCNAIDVTSRHQNNTTIRNCSIKNTGMIAGMGSFWDDNDYKAISVTVSSDALVEYNSIENTGFVGIQFQGNNINIQNNFINNYDIVKDDGGGIYTYQSGTDASPGTSYKNRTIQNNIVMNGIGTTAGTNSDIDVDGIFLDGRTTNVNVLNNTLANIGVNGIYSNNSHDVKIRGNTCFNNGSAIGITKYSWGSISNLSVTQNIFYPKYNTQNNFQYVNTGLNLPVLTTIQSAMQNIGLIDSNYIAIPNPTGYYYYYALVAGGGWIFPESMSFNTWKTYTNHDRTSKQPYKIASDVDKDLRFEYNATKSVKTVALDAKYVGVDGTVFNGTISLQPYTSKILVRDGAITGTQQTLNANASAPPIACFGSSTTVSVTGAGGTAPYSGTGNYTVNAGKGSLKISVNNPDAEASTLVYSSVGDVSSSKTYVLRFSTLGTTNNGSLKASIRQTNSPYAYLTSAQSASFGTSRVDHQFKFTAPTSDKAASFLIELSQSSGTTYIDNVAFFEATSAGVLISENRYDNGQFESSISDIYTWSPGNNHTASLDLSGKMTNTYYYPVKDANGVIATATAEIVQPNSPLQALTNAEDVLYPGGTTTVVVTATGGTPPYSGTGSFSNIQVGSYTYRVTDANGCISISNITVSQSATSGPAFTGVVNIPPITCFGANTPVTVSGSGGLSPYAGTGSYNVSAGTASLKISVDNPRPRAYTLVYAPVGEVNSTKNYVLRFSTLGTTANGSLRASLRQTLSPWANLTASQNRSFGNSREDHEFLFKAPESENSASFLIEILQSSGTVYIDNIALFEATPEGVLISNNLFKNGQFENGMGSVTVWSAYDGGNNHSASLDQTSKIGNTYYFPIRDALGTVAIAQAVTSQPSSPLVATSSAAGIVSSGGTTTVIVSATGGTAPYSGTGSFSNVKAGTYNYTVTDANGCSSVTTISVNQSSSSAARMALPVTAKAVVPQLNSLSLAEEAAFDINSYPNPSDNEFTLAIRGGSDEIVNISVFGTDGKIVYKTSGSTNRNFLFGHNLMPGMYIVQVIQGKTMRTLKVVKAK